MDTNTIRGKIDFGIITIREDEYRAVLQRFGVGTFVEGNRRYVVSRIKTMENDEYLVALVCCPEQGEGEGQDVARDLIVDLDPQWILLVGIGGGVPHDDFTLGDVVVATRLHDFCIEATLDDRWPEYGVRGGPMHKAVQDLVAQLPAMDQKLKGWNDVEAIGMQHPPVSLTARNFYGDEDWQKDVKKKLTKYFRPNSIPRQPKVTTGAVASSDRLVKSTKTVETWKKVARQIQAIEMELAGVYQAARRKDREYPVLAIRGISDIVGFKRDQNWTTYACHSAASFAYAFVKTGLIKPPLNHIDREFTVHIDDPPFQERQASTGTEDAQQHLKALKLAKINSLKFAYEILSTSNVIKENQASKALSCIDKVLIPINRVYEIVRDKSEITIDLDLQHKELIIDLTRTIKELKQIKHHIHECSTKSKSNSSKEHQFVALDMISHQLNQIDQIIQKTVVLLNISPSI